jgi:methionyl-tRNA formyltransferase
MTLPSPPPTPRVVVFAYHDIGVRCIQVLQARGIDIALVVTHQDNPQETIWFASVAALCTELDIPFITPETGRDASLLAAVAAVQPDFIFSFYYRHMLPVTLLALAQHGAFNLHGSLLPKYRGRVPVNWAVLHGETETGVSLHQMTAKPDAGYLVAQVAVPILPDDTAHEVFGKLSVAAEQCLWNALPALCAGNAPQLPNDLTQGSYFGGRKPEDGRINWQQSAQQVYNLHRAVAPPYPGAFTTLGEHNLVLVRARLLKHPTQAQIQHCAKLPCGLTVCGNMVLGICGDRALLHILAIQHHGQNLTPAQCAALLAT